VRKASQQRKATTPRTALDGPSAHAANNYSDATEEAQKEAKFFHIRQASLALIESEPPS
jgi:hypothetical protein